VSTKTRHFDLMI